MKRSHMEVARTAVGTAVVLAAAVMLFASCSVPTDSPAWDTRWIVPAEDAGIPVSEFLPGSVDVTPDGDAFTVQVEAFAFSKSLGEACPPCEAWNGQTVPKPAFQMSLEGSTDLPSGVLSVEVERVAVAVWVTNGFSFDPIRPGGDDSGNLVLQLFGGDDGGALLDEVTVDGAVEEFPPGSVLAETLRVAAGSQVSRFRAAIQLDSPEGDSVRVDTDDRLDVEVTPIAVRVASARVEVAGREIAMDSVELDAADVDGDIADRVRSGAIEIFVENPFGVGAELGLRVSGSFPDITKSMRLSAAAASTTRVEFTGEEMRRFLGRSSVMLSGTGTVSAEATPITVAPRDTVKMDTRLDVVLRVGDEK